MKSNYSLRFRIGHTQVQITNNPYAINSINSWNTERHSNASIELHYILSGTCVIEINNKQIPITQESLLLISPGIFHASFSNNKNLRHVSISFKLADQDGQRKLSTLISGFKIIQLDEQLKNLGKTMINELEKNDSYSKTAISCAIQETIIYLFRYFKFSEHEDDSKIYNTDVSTITDQFFETNYKDKNGEEELAQILNISTRQLSRVLQKIYSKTYKELITDAKMAHAEWMLIHTDMPVGEISKQIGYDSPTSLITQIKKKFGITPNQYRKKASYDK